jgi:hypothetical protein
LMDASRIFSASWANAEGDVKARAAAVNRMIRGNRFLQTVGMWVLM